LRADDGSVASHLSRDIVVATKIWLPQHNFAKMLSTSTDITCIRCTSTRKRIEHHGLAVRIKSTNDAVKFGKVTSEFTELICERPVRHGQKTGVFRRISPDILDLFSQFFLPHESTLRADDGSV